MGARKIFAAVHAARIKQKSDENKRLEALAMGEEINEEDEIKAFTTDQSTVLLDRPHASCVLFIDMGAPR